MKYSNIFASRALFEMSVLRNRLHVACRNECQKSLFFCCFLSGFPSLLSPQHFFYYCFPMLVYSDQAFQLSDYLK